MPSITLRVTYRTRTTDVAIDLAAASGDGDDAAQFDALRHAVVAACGVDPAKEPRARLLGRGGKVVVPRRSDTTDAPAAAAAAAKREVLPSEIEDGSLWALLCPAATTLPSASEEADSPATAPTTVASSGVPAGPLSADDVDHLLRCCTGATLPGEALRQPRFVFTLYLETEGERAPRIPVCGPCAHACLKMKHVHIMDPPGALERPFQCACRSILADAHECFWACDRSAGALDAAERQQLRTAWRREHRTFADHITAQLEAEAKDAQEHELKKLTERLRGAVDLFDQYRDEDALAAARAVIPVAALEERARRDIATTLEIDAAANRRNTDESDGDGVSRLHHAMLRQLVSWFHDDFFQWMQRPPCPRCEGGRTEPVPKERKKAELTHEERQNWAAGVELYECRDCGAEARFPRYQRAKRLLTYRKGRCGEFATCFALCAAAVGYDVRMISSSADRAWNEVYSTYARRWLHVDASKGLVDAPLKDETSGKLHPYVFAVSGTEVVDVSLRYTSNALRYIAGDRTKYSEAALSKLIRGLCRTGSLRVDKSQLAFYEQRQRREREELAAPFTAEEGESALDAAESFVLTATARGGNVDSATFDGDDESADAHLRPDVGTVVSIGRGRGVVAAVERVEDQDGSGDTDGHEERRWAPLSTRNGPVALTISGPETHFELATEGRATGGAVLPVPPAPNAVLVPYTFVAFRAVVEPRSDGAATADFGIGPALHLSVRWGGAEQDAAHVTLKYPDLKPLSDHGKLGGHAPVVPGLGELRLRVPLTPSTDASSQAPPSSRAVALGFTLDVFGVLRLAGRRPVDDDPPARAATASATSHALVAPHALSESCGGNDAALRVFGQSVKVTASTSSRVAHDANDANDESRAVRHHHLLSSLR
eukprot:CAMPEP_0174843060 /NCGR_PEP_ID=MMETSP1114-20130205/10280_1 /TAXON_ID=312471 /ORGANISM="Neobodo designis, Strain CCAP 1951/1" /LENGTH=888 /DNA_ID=CAMNT_0016077273 /DNA_START=41 /DNA_END=2704 /DNA_ORIENTATION=+